LKIKLNKNPTANLKKVSTSRMQKSAYRLNNYINLLTKIADYKRLKMICRLSSANGLFTNDVQRPFKSALQTSISKTRRNHYKDNLLTVMQVFGNATDFSFASSFQKPFKKHCTPA